MKRSFSIMTIPAAVLTTCNLYAATLVSSARTAADVDMSGSGIFAGSSGVSAPEIGGVTTTVVSNPGSLNGKFSSGSTGPKTVTLRAVSATNGMDLTYDVVFSPFRYRGDTDTDQATSTAILGAGAGAAVSSDGSNSTRNQTNFLTSNGDDFREFFRVDIGNVVNSGTTDYELDGAVTVSILGLSGIGVYDTYALDSFGTQLALDGTGTAAGGVTDLALSAPVESFAIVATADDTGTNAENLWTGLAVQFTVVPEPGSLALLTLGGLCVLRRRRD